MKIIYLDTETGGPDPHDCALLQLSAAIEIDWEIKEKLDYYIIPYGDDPPITQEAIDKHGITPEIIQQNPDNRFLNPNFVFANLKHKLETYVNPYDKTDKFFAVGYNILTFDDIVLRKFWKRNNDEYYGSWFWWPPIDMMAIGADILMNRRLQIANYQLDTIAKELGVKVDTNQLHNAMYDVQVVREMFIRHLRNKSYVYSVFSKYRTQYEQEKNNG
ncbi:MAG: 3'-5' exonuclease [Melioribacteraceae bacterium]|nr:3'-5' exonuclease [Melioribacteraceae bacterium]